MKAAAEDLCQQLGITLPVIGGAMYPCSNPELVAAVSAAGGLGVIQPLSLTYVQGYEFRAGIHYLRKLTDKPLGLNLLVEQSSQRYLDRVKGWLDIALEEQLKFFVTALGNPRFVVERVHAAGGLVFHNTTSREWADKALAAGVDGLICVNDRAGGHAGTESALHLYEELSELGKTLVSAGGLSDPRNIKAMVDLGYAGVQLGTRFIASSECSAALEYKQAIVAADESHIVLTDKLSGVPVSIIETEHIRRIGAQTGPLARWLLKHRRSKKYMRLFYTLRSFRSLKAATLQGNVYDHYLQAGKSVGGIQSILPVAEIMAAYRDVLA